MAKSEHKIIGSDEEIQFKFNFPVTTKDKKSLAWGNCIVSVFGEDVWFTEDKNGNRSHVSWTWVDLLEFLGRSWANLLLEEIYPVDVNPVNPRQLRHSLATRWENFVKDVVHEEDEAIYNFESRHDFARGMKGIQLPSIFLLRQGKLAWLCTESYCKLISLDRILSVLEEVGDYLSSLLENSDNSRAKLACQTWNCKTDRVQQSFIGYRSGLSKDAIKQLQGQELPDIFWEINIADNYADSEILAAARMSSSVAGVDVQAKILAVLKSLGKQKTTYLDSLSDEYKRGLAIDEGRPYEDGYRLARWLRNKLGVPSSSSVNPRDILNKWNIAIKVIELNECRIDAIACWGSHHGPAIVLNAGSGSRAKYNHGERSTLAHEISHLLVDRGNALQAAEVLGGLTPKYVEQKANAFAAEFLIPQESVKQYIQQNSNIKSAVDAMVNHFDVSAQLIGWQIKNSGIHQILESVERSYIDQITSDFVTV